MSREFATIFDEVFSFTKKLITVFLFTFLMIFQGFPFRHKEKWQAVVDTRIVSEQTDNKVYNWAIKRETWLTASSQSMEWEIHGHWLVGDLTNHHPCCYSFSSCLLLHVHICPS